MRQARGLCRVAPTTGSKPGLGFSLLPALREKSRCEYDGSPFFGYTRPVGSPSRLLVCLLLLVLACLPPFRSFPTPFFHDALYAFASPERWLSCCSPFLLNSIADPATHPLFQCIPESSIAFFPFFSFFRFSITLFNDPRAPHVLDRCVSSHFVIDR